MPLKKKFQSHGLALMFGAAFIFFLLSALNLALRRHLDSTDGYTFILQSRRLLDPLYAWVNPMLIRPRGLVVLFSALEASYALFAARFPTLPEYHVFMVLVAAVSIGVWVRFLSRLFGSVLGFCVGIAMCLHATLIENASLCLSDILAGFFFALLLNLMLTHLQRGEANPDSLRKMGRPLVIGLLGAMLAVSKHQVFLLFPFCLGLLASLVFIRNFLGAGNLGHWKKHIAWMGIATLSFLLNLDFINRIFTEPGQGVGSHLHYFAQIVQYARDVVPHFTIGSDPLTYLKDFRSCYGWFFIGLGSIGAVLTLRKSNPKVGWRGLSAAQKICLLIFVLSSALFILQTQLFANKETRYLLPFLPFLLTLVCLPLVWVAQHAQGRTRLWWLSFCVLALVHPVVESWAQVRAENLAQNNWFESPSTHFRMWFYLMKPNANGSQCQSLHVCDNPHSGLPFTWAYFFFHMGFKPQVSECTASSDYRSLRESLTEHARLGACYLLSLKDPTEKGNSMLVEKYLGSHLSGKELSRLQTNLRSDEFLDCGPNPGVRSICFIARRFSNL